MGVDSRPTPVEPEGQTARVVSHWIGLRPIAWQELDRPEVTQKRKGHGYVPPNHIGTRKFFGRALIPGPFCAASILGVLYREVMENANAERVELNVFKVQKCGYVSVNELTSVRCGNCWIKSSYS
jgi:hypothetical protein